MSSLKRTLARQRKRIVMRGDTNHMTPERAKWVQMAREKLRMAAKVAQIEEQRKAEVEQKRGR